MQTECTHTVMVARLDRVKGWVRVCDVCGYSVPLAVARGLLESFTAPTGASYLWARHGKPEGRIGKGD